MFTRDNDFDHLFRGMERPVTSILSSQVLGDTRDQSTALQDEPVSINFTIKDVSHGLIIKLHAIKPLRTTVGSYCSCL